jgi:hypothetical protein
MRLETTRVSIARQECINTFKPNHFVCPAFLDFIKISKHNVCVKNAIPDNIQTTRNLPNVHLALSAITKTLRRRHLAYHVVPASLTTWRKLSAASSVGKTPTPIKSSAPPRAIRALPDGLPATAARRARLVRPVLLNKKTSVKNAIQVYFQTIQDSPNATSAIQGNTVNRSKQCAFPASLAKRVLLLDKNATNAPKATSPIKKNKSNVNPVKRMNTNRKRE